MTETSEYQFSSDELGNCPNCAEQVVRESVFVRTSITYYWPCLRCGFTWHGAQIPDLD